MSRVFKIEEEAVFVKVRMGKDAYTARGADVIFGFEYPSDAMLFQDGYSHGSQSRFIEKIYPTSREDFLSYVQETGMFAVYRTDCVEGKMYAALPQWCATEDYLRAVCEENSLGWGVYSFSIGEEVE